LESIKLEDVTKEAKEKGDGGDLDDEADDFLDHNAAMVEAIVERQEGTEDEEVIVIDDSDRNLAVLLKRPGPVIDIKVPGTPDDWVPAEQKEDKGQPAFIDVDNPGDWSLYTFRPEFTKATPVPLVSQQQKRTGWLGIPLQGVDWNKQCTKRCIS
jgi:hypothetical protein